MPRIIQLGNTYAQGQSPYEIFQDRMSAVQGLAHGIKKIRENIYTNKMMEAYIDDLDMHKDKNQIEFDINNFKYTETQDREIEEFASEAMGILEEQATGMMSQHERLMGITPSTPSVDEALMGGIPEATEVAGQQEGFSVPKGSFEMIFNQIQSMEGSIDFNKTLEVMRNRPKWMGMTQMESNLLEHMMGQPSQKDKLMSDLQMTQDIQNILFPEVAQQREIDTYTKKLIAQESIKKMFEEPEKEFTLEDEKALIDYYKESGYEITNIQRHTTGTVSFNIQPIKTAETIDWGQALQQADDLARSIGLEPSGMSTDPNTGLPKITYARPLKETGTTSTTATVDTATGEPIPYSSGKPLANATNAIRDELSKITNLEGLENFARQYGEMGYITSHLLTPEFQTDFFIDKANRYRQALEFAVQSGETNTAGFKNALQQYNNFRDTVNNLGIKEIPEFNYEKGTIEKVTSFDDNQVLAQELIKKFNNLEEAIAWVNTNKGAEIETDDGKKLRINWDNLIRLLQEYSDPTEKFKDSLRGL